jgi:malonyl-CoA/methylmalonyl-CoA synthetase
MPNPLYDQLFGRHAGQNTPFLQLEDGSVLSHADFLSKAAQFSNVFKDHGLKAGDRVAVQVAKSPECLAVYASCVQSGLVFLPLNTDYTASELRYFLADSGAALIICSSTSSTQIQPMADELIAVLLTLDANNTGSLIDLAADQPDSFQAVDRSADDLAALLYTSGTTGRSKGAMLSQGNLLSNAQTLVKEWQFTADDVLLHALPIFHTHGLFVAAHVTLLAGGSMVFMPKFNLDTMIEWMPKSTCLMGVPTFYTRLLQDPRFSQELTAHMRLFISGSAPLLAETHVQFQSLTGHRILERYGMTETNMNTSNPFNGDRRAGTVGPALPGVEVKITRPDSGEALPQGEIGQIEVRGPNVFQGYWKMPEKTAEELRADGFFITGDLGTLDEDGYLTIVGRNKDLIISGGYNIYPKEIELILDEQSGVLESAVVGISDADFGESVVGIVVPESGQTVDLEGIKAALSLKLARFKQPRKLFVVNELPRNTMGKVQKNILRDQYSNPAT